MDIYMDASKSTTERVNSLMSQMTLEEKINQIACKLIISPMPMIEETFDVVNGVGQIGIMSGRGSGVEQAQLIRTLQEKVLNSSRFGIPAIFHSEALSGMCFSSSLAYPTSVSLAATFDPDIVKDMGQRIRKQMLSIGVRQALSPVLDIAYDLRWGRLNETYGNDPTLVSSMACGFIEGLQSDDLSKGIAATAKHFVGYSATEGGVNMAKTVVSDREIRELYCKPFEAAITNAELASVMNSYSEINGKPICASEEILNELLREDLGFGGLIVSDYSSIERLVNNFKTAKNMNDAAIQCLRAGLDVELPSGAGYNSNIIDAVNEGRLSEGVIDRACFKSLELKFKLGLFENPYPLSDEEVTVAFNNTENNAKSLEAARKAMTMTKNEGILPLVDKNLKIAVIGPTGNSLRKQWSSYSAVAMDEMLMMSAMSMAGVETDTSEGNTGMKVKHENPAMVESLIRQNYPESKTIFEALNEIYPNCQYVQGCHYNDKSNTNLDAAIEMAKSADVVILTVGGKNGWGAHCTIGEAFDSSNISLPGSQELLMKVVGEANPNFIIVHTDARPLVSSYGYENAKAIIEGWLCNNHAGKVIAETISGLNNPGGCLQMDVPIANGVLSYHHQRNASHYRTIQDMGGGAYVDLPDEIISRPFGYGLSYASFELKNASIKVSNQQIPTINISVDVVNTSEIMGDKVIQIYGKDIVASMIRPNKELIGFKRVTLKPGQTKKIVFTFKMDVLSFMNDEHRWICENGDYEFYVGSNSEDEEVCLRYILGDDVFINPNNRTFYADARVVEQIGV